MRERFSKFQRSYPATFVVESGHGLQAYWRLTRDVEPAEGADFIARMHAALGAAGLVADRADLASVLRLPGTFNLKSEPVEVRLV